MANNWRETSRIFNDKASEYDSWFDNSLVYQIERDALAGLETICKSPKIEIGVGPGRFAQDLGIEVGIDPALAALGLAKARDINTINAVAEDLPIKSVSMETAYLLLALCFLNNPQTSIKDIHRILIPGGHLILGMINNPSPWEQALTKKKEAGHPFYEQANFYKTNQVKNWLNDAGFTVIETISTLLQAPAKVTIPEKAVVGINQKAGFAILVGRKS